MAVLQPYKYGYYLWKYLPSIPAGIIFCLLFAAITGLHCWSISKTRAWFFIPFIIGGFMEVIGYIVRCAAYERTNKLMPYAIQNSMILLAPVLFAATIYATLGRIMRAVGGERYSIIRPAWVTRLFVTGDVFSLLVQGGAAGLMIMAEHAKMGQAIVIAGLVFQVLLFGLFCLTTAMFHLRMRRSSGEASKASGINWEHQVYVLYSVSALVMLRSIFRLIEFIMGQDGYLLSTEWPLYVFDAIPMLIVMVIFWFGFARTPKRPGSWASVTSLSVLGCGARGGDESAAEEARPGKSV